MTNTLYVYCPNPSPRIRYVFEYLRIQWNLEKLLFLNEINFSVHSEQVIINYSFDDLHHKTMHFMPCSITDPGRRMYPDQIEWVEGLPYFFKTNSSAVGLEAFDVPGMIFYMLSRMEEYDNTNPDLLGRMVGKNSFAANNGFLNLPVVDLWLEKLANFCFPNIQNIKSSFQCKLTVDIDIAWAFANRPLWENLGGACKELMSFRWKRFQTRWAVCNGSMKDPFDVYDYFKQVHERHGPVQYFILLGDRSTLDRSFHWKNTRFIELIHQLKSHSSLGIHPSSRVSKNLSILLEEKQKLESILGYQVQKSRHHYLMINLPQTYRDLIAAGIKEDNTMGFHDLPGFRAGTSKQFNWYDLELEESTELKVLPFFVMDVTLKNYLNLSANEAAEWMQQQKKQFTSWKLPMTIIWHNSSFFELDGWKDWSAVLEIIFPMQS